MQKVNRIKGAKSLKRIVSVVTEIYDTARITIGPEGQNGLLPRTFNRGPRITNDGIMNMENLKFTHPADKLIAESFLEASKKTNLLAGDGTTGTALVGGTLYLDLVKLLPNDEIPAISAGVQTKGVRSMRKELKDAKDEVIKKIRARKTDVTSLEELEKIAIVSIGKEDEDAAKEVAKLVWDIGRDANGDFVDNHIDVVEGYKGKVETEVIKGMRFPAKMAHKFFITNKERFEMVAEDTQVLITNYKLDNPEVIIGLLKALRVSKIAIFAPEFSDTVLMSLIRSFQNGVFIYPVKCPSLRTEVMEDLAAYTGAKVIDKSTGQKLNNVLPTDLGFAEKIVVKADEIREDAVLLGGRGEQKKVGEENRIEQRVKELKGQLEESQNDLTRITLQKRIASLSSAVGIIRVGSSTNNESLFLKLKIEDGQYACKSALRPGGGYVKGGGLCLKEISEELPEGNLLKSALSDPYNQIQKNAGGDLEIGPEIIDSSYVVELQVEHAVSVASMMLTIGQLFPDLQELSPAEGYEKIAEAINSFTYFFAKDKGVLRASEDEAERDRNEAFENVLLNDHD